MTAQELANRFKRLRNERGLSQVQFANLCDMHEAHIANLEKGDRYPQYDTLLKLAAGFGITASELIKEEEPTIGVQNVFLNRVEAETKVLGDKDKTHLLKMIREYVKAIKDHMDTSL